MQANYIRTTKVLDHLHLSSLESLVNAYGESLDDLNPQTITLLLASISRAVAFSYSPETDKKPHLMSITYHFIQLTGITEAEDKIIFYLDLLDAEIDCEKAIALMEALCIVLGDRELEIPGV